MILDKKKRIYEISNDYVYIAITLLVSLLMFFISNIFKNEIYAIFNVMDFLTWFTLLEILSVIFAFIIFNNCYHSYKHTKKLRTLILSVTFFIVGCLNLLYVLSYEGMLNASKLNSIKMAVTYYIIVRLIIGLGIFLASITPILKEVKINGKIILVLSFFLTFIFFHMINYKFDIIYPLFIQRSGVTKLKIFLDYFIILLKSFSIFNFLKNYRNTSNKYLLILSSGLMLMIFSQALCTNYRNICDVFNFLGHLYNTIGFYLIYHSIFKYNIDMPYIKLKEAQERIKLYVNNLEKIVDIKTKEFREANEILNMELDYAKVIQQSLLPPNKMSFGNVRFISEYIPCEKLSGDFYDIYEIDKDNIGMYILDVTGHGVPAALLTMFSINNIKSNERLIKRYRGLKPHKNLKHFYEEFNKLNFPEEMHIVIFFATYNISKKVLTYCSAGMNCCPTLITPTGKYEFLDKSKGFPICQLSKFYTPEYESAKIQLDKGDKIIFYTDGLVEMQKNAILSDDDLINILLKNRKNNIETLNKSIVKKLKGSKKTFNDDITYFIMEVM